MNMRKALAFLAFAALACGKRGDPHPPVPIIPKATSDLVVAQRGPQVLLWWSFPSLTTAGQNLTKVRRVVVYRAVEELPVAQPPRDASNLLPAETDPAVPPPIALFSKVPPLSPAQFVKLRTRVDSIESAKLPGSTVGAKLTYEDTPPFHTADGRPVRLDYAVVTEGFNASSDLSSIASLVPIDVPVPPPSLTATAKAEGVVLEWTAPATSITAKAKPFIAGYNVYRLSQGETASSFETPVNTSPVSKTTYTDVPPYGTFTYRVTAVSSMSPRIESDPSPPASATFKDLLAPPPPTGLTALVEAKAVRLVWEPVTAPDLAGYRLYRTEGTGQTELREVGTVPLQPSIVTTPYYVDSRVELGISYKYGVSSVDKSGNESERVWTDWILVPKTP